MGEQVTQAVITVPAYFNDAQRQATKDAGRIAGLEVLRLVNEPTAAALAYGLDKRKNGIVAVYDLGGGTFDISILKLHDGIFEVLATNGDTHLGGDDIDNLLLRIALEDIQNEWGEDLSQDGSGRCRLLRRAVIEAKEELSFVPAATIDFDLPAASATSAKSRASCSKADRAGIVDRTLGPCRDCIKDAGVAGRTDRRSGAWSAARRAFRWCGRRSRTLFRARPHTELNPDEVVALGAAVQAGILIRRRSRISCCST